MTTQTMPADGADLAAMFPDEVVTKCPVRDIAARRGLPLEDVAPAAMLRARAGQGV